ncbi:MAG: nucleotidyltransferase [Cytophagales bacterium]|nr:MAG: nucleotidyltransferase [Cytophagales bacterium]
MQTRPVNTNQKIILECISGSKAYGLDTPTSDTDIKGVFLLSQKEFYGLEYTPQVSNETNDVVFYEFRRFMELLSLNNPNILELLNTPSEHVIFKHPILQCIEPSTVLSRLCKDTFGKFAYTQIKKAKGLNKKILNPMTLERKNLLHFCYINHEQGAIPLLAFLEHNQWQPEHCGLVGIPHMKNLYGLYYDKQANFNGIIKQENATEVSLSSVAKELKPMAFLYFNKEGYSAYCKEHREYWQWVEKRNEERYQNTKSHGKNYDAKNMMHVFRLLEMAHEIATENKINVKRPNREFLLEIKAGNYEYEALLEMAEQKRKAMEKAFEQSNLPEKPNREFLNALTYEIRKALYQEK